MRGEIKRDMFVCSLGEGDWEKLDYRLRAFFVFHYYYCSDYPYNYDLLPDNESYDDCVVVEVDLGEDY